MRKRNQNPRRAKRLRRKKRSEKGQKLTPIQSITMRNCMELDFYLKTISKQLRKE